jgi:hypothetical protein
MLESTRMGSLCEQSGYEYNQSPATGMIVYANSVACGSGTYYAYGLMAAWNGSTTSTTINHKVQISTARC